MAAPKPNNSGRTLAGRFTRKVGPLPVWAWAAVILGIILLYMRLRPDTAAAEPTSPAASNNPPTTTAGDTGAGFPAGSGGDVISGDILAQLHGTNAATIDSLTAALLTQSSIRAADPAAGAPPGSSSQAGPAASPAGSVPVTATASLPRGATQTASGSLAWDGQVFTTKAGFDRWAKTHGTTPAAVFRNHPAAQRIYLTLK